MAPLKRDLLNYSKRSEFEENYIIKENVYNSFIKQLSEHNWTAILVKSKWLRRETKAKSITDKKSQLIPQAKHFSLLRQSVRLRHVHGIYSNDTLQFKI